MILTTGCGADTGSVSGTVTFKGDKVPSGTISFIVGDRLFQAALAFSPDSKRLASGVKG